MERQRIEWRDPASAIAPLAGEPYACLLHGGAGALDARWSILAAFPARRLECRGGVAVLDGVAQPDGPFEVLSRLHRSRRSLEPADEAPFRSGLIGFVGYEAGAVLEPTAAGPKSPFRLPDMAFGAYDSAIVFDRKMRTAELCSRTREAGVRLIEAIKRPAPAAAAERPVFCAASSNFTASRYRAAVADVVGKILDGVLFQANIAQHLCARSDDGAAFGVFRALADGDAAFGSFLNYEAGAIVSASPERFFAVNAHEGAWRVTAEPIKGTRRRGALEEDAALAAELIGDAKERAENIMIADLTRSDLSRICRDDSIREEAICELLSTRTVHHLVSRISGALSDGLTPVDALKAMFPCGSVTGAPKVEAMRTIAEIEGVGRGPYCGAIGYIDDRGGADFSVAIRTIVFEREGRGVRATFPVGGGVTLRSDPHQEHEETLVKARALLEALGSEAPRP